MAQYISKDALVAEIKRRKELVSDPILLGNDLMIGERNAYFNLLPFLDTLEVKELAPMAYVVTRCEEHSDYVEEVFFNEDKAQAYCDQFRGNENEYARYITKVKVTL